MTLPKTEDVRRAREQAVDVLNAAVEQIRTPLLAALGAGDLATRAVVDAVNRARTQVSERTEQAKDAVDELPGELSGLRDRLDPAELRKLVDEYTDAAQKLYLKLADAGEDALTKLRAQPQVKRALDQLEDAIVNLQERVGDVAGDAREIADEVLATVTRQTRSVGERAARTTQRTAADAADAIQDAGDEVAHELRSSSRKAANRTAPSNATSGTKATSTGTTGTRATSTGTTGTRATSTGTTGAKASTATGKTGATSGKAGTSSGKTGSSGAKTGTTSSTNTRKPSTGKRTAK